MSKKLIAPVIVTILLAVVCFLYAFFCAMMPFPFKLTALIPLAFLGVSVYVLLERIKEVRSGEEDDLSKY